MPINGYNAIFEPDKIEKIYKTTIDINATLTLYSAVDSPIYIIEDTKLKYFSLSI